MSNGGVAQYIIERHDDIKWLCYMNCAKPTIIAHYYLLITHFLAKRSYALCV